MTQRDPLAVSRVLWDMAYKNSLRGMLAFMGPEGRNQNQSLLSSACVTSQLSALRQALLSNALGANKTLQKSFSGLLRDIHIH